MRSSCLLYITQAIAFKVSLLYLCHIHCVSKMFTTLACYNVNVLVHESVLMIFGRNVAEKVGIIVKVSIVCVT